MKMLVALVGLFLLQVATAAYEPDAGCPPIDGHYNGNGGLCEMPADCPCYYGEYRLGMGQCDENPGSACCYPRDMTDPNEWNPCGNPCPVIPGHYLDREGQCVPKDCECNYGEGRPGMGQCGQEEGSFCCYPRVMTTDILNWEPCENMACPPIPGHYNDNGGRCVRDGCKCYYGEFRPGMGQCDADMLGSKCCYPRYMTDPNNWFPCCEERGRCVEKACQCEYGEKTSKATPCDKADGDSYCCRPRHMTDPDNWILGNNCTEYQSP